MPRGALHHILYIFLRGEKRERCVGTYASLINMFGRPGWGGGVKGRSGVCVRAEGMDCLAEIRPTYCQGWVTSVSIIIPETWIKPGNTPPPPQSGLIKGPFFLFKPKRFLRVTCGGNRLFIHEGGSTTAEISPESKRASEAVRERRDLLQ